MAESFVVESIDVGVRVVGELDMATAPDLERAIADLDVKQSSVIVDMRACTFVDAAGIHALLRSGDLLREGGATLVVRSPNPIVLRLFKIAGVNGDAPLAVET